MVLSIPARNFFYDLHDNCRCADNGFLPCFVLVLESQHANVIANRHEIKSP